MIPPVCTPLTETLDVDVPSLERLIDFLLESGVNGLFVLGSSGETAYLPDRCRRDVLEVAVSRVAGQVPVLAGVIDTATLRVLDHAEAAQKAGADGIVATAPFYTRTHRAEVEQHFRRIAAGVDLPLYAYDLPVSVHRKLDAELLLTLARDGVIHGLKDSSGDDGAFRTLVLATQDLADFSLLTGSELTVDSALRIGGDGAVPGLGNVDPAGYARLYRHAQDGNWDAAGAEQVRLIRLFDIVRVGSAQRMGPSSAALGAFKMALHLRGIIDCPVTAPPQIPLNSGETGEIRRLLEVAGLL
jgi:4-hydroxy-tetrahydrodipicolinate synthase